MVSEDLSCGGICSLVSWVLLGFLLTVSCLGDVHAHASKSSCLLEGLVHGHLRLGRLWVTRLTFHSYCYWRA